MCVPTELPRRNPRPRVAGGRRSGRHVKLARRGRDYVGLCPFHKEKTPSFNVVEDKNFITVSAAARTAM